MENYIPSKAAWVRDQVELIERTNGAEGTTLKESGLPVILVTHRGRKTGAVRKTPLMRAVDGSNTYSSHRWVERPIIRVGTTIWLPIPMWKSAISPTSIR